jgi:hypothetical protein
MKFTTKDFFDAIETHPMGKGVQAKIEIGDGEYILSAVGGAFVLHGDGKETFEIAIFDRETGELIDLPHGDKVLGEVYVAQIVNFINTMDKQVLLI